MSYVEYVNSFCQTIKIISTDLLRRFPNDPMVYRAHKRVTTIIGLDPKLVIDVCGPYLYEYREKIYADKRARAIGVANYTLPFLEELKTYANIVPAVNQIEFTPWLFQEDLMNYCKKQGTQLQSYSPITRGQKFNDPRLVSLCEKYQKTPAQIILNWNLQLGISTIPKSSKRERLLENFEATSFSLTLQDVAFMNTFNEGFRICDDPIIFL